MIGKRETEEDMAVEMEALRRHRSEDTSDVPSRAGVDQMFDRISHRYDLLNHLLSLGLDFVWRRRAIDHLGDVERSRILDLACGTGDLAIAAARRKKYGYQVIGADKAARMLQIANAKIAKRHLSKSINLIRGDGMALPFRDASFDAAMIAFGIRNMSDTGSCLSEINRLLKVGGQVIVLEFSHPANTLIKALYRCYLRRIVPLVGRLISGDAYAYSYLDRTIETYLHGEQLCEALRASGFVEIKAEAITMGTVTIYTGRKI